MEPVPGATPDGATSLGGGGATGLSGSSSASNGGQTSPGSLPDAGIADTPSDLAVSTDLASAKPDLVLQSDAASKPDVVPPPDGSYKDGETSPDVGIVLYGLTPGPYCYTITSVLPGGNDGCDLGVAELDGVALPGNYDPSTGTFML